jgi:streptomycin 6-kinase
MKAKSESIDAVTLGRRAQARWHLADMQPLAQTPTSTLWRARHGDFGDVVLKILTPYGADEGFGFDLMQAAGGQGMARLYARQGGEGLMEYLPGGALSALVQAGDDLGAARVIADLARAIGGASPHGLVPLGQHLQALLQGDFAPLPAPLRPMLGTAQALCSALLAGEDPRALHGDLHHDNILQGPRGWLAIDAKGLVGDPAYEFANAFRNPRTCPELVRSPARITALAEVFAANSGLKATRILQWAVAHCACSLLWSAQSGDDLAGDKQLLPVLVAAADGRELGR